MFRRLLRRLVGIDKVEQELEELKRKQELSDATRGDLENRVLESEELNNLIRQDVAQANLSNETTAFLEGLGIEITNSTRDAALMAMQAADLAERYGFRRFVPPTEDQYPKSVITLRDLQEHPEKYIHKLNQGILNFPVGLNFEGVNEILEGLYGNCQISPSSSFSNNGTFDFVLSAISKNYMRQHPSNLLVKVMDVSSLNRVKCGEWVHIDTLDFMANYKGIEQFIIERPDLTTIEKENAIKALRIAEMTYLTAAEIAGKTRIMDSADLLGDIGSPASAGSSAPASEGREQYLAAMSSAYENLRTQILESLISQPKYTSEKDLEKLLPIRSKERFRLLASERTLEIIASDKESKGLTSAIGKPIEEYTIGESIVLACYFARNIITRYETLEDSVKNIFMDNVDKKVSGKCTDYTGLALQYLREYLVPLHPKKFEGWKFGYDSQIIGDYRHCYIKAIHVNPDRSIDVYFLDPTVLANKGISALKTPQEVLEYMDTSRHPLMIQRDAEDLLSRPLDDGKKGPLQ